jgi:hypothetical protein
MSEEYYQIVGKRIALFHRNGRLVATDNDDYRATIRLTSRAAG